MSNSSVRALLGAMHASLVRGESEITLRDHSDREFRTMFLAFQAADGVPGEVRSVVRSALLALVGDDAWTTARLYLEDAMDVLEGRSAMV